MPSSKPRRRWLQFRLRTLLVALTLVSLLLGYVAWEREQCRRGEQTLKALGRHLAQLNPKDFGHADRPVNPSGRTGWSKFILGDDQFRKVEFVGLGGLASDSHMRHLAALPNLRGVMIGPTNVTDEGVAHLRGLKTVEIFYFIRNEKVSGKSWDFLAGWHHLSELTIGCDRFDDESLRKLAVLTNLKKLDIRLTRITDAGLEGISSLTTLEALDLSETEVTDAGLRHLSHLTNLQDFNLGGTKVTDEGMKRLSRLTNLKKLSLLDTQVTDEGLAQLPQLVNLEYLDVSNTQVSDAGLVHLKSMTNLSYLDLMETKVTTAGASDLQRALPNASVMHGEP